jgi:hypothetical protein
LLKRNESAKHSQNNGSGLLSSFCVCEFPTFSVFLGEEAKAFLQIVLVKNSCGNWGHLIIEGSDLIAGKASVWRKKLASVLFQGTE